MKKIVKKWEGGAKKHGGIGKAMGVQIDKWIQRDEEQAKEAREAEELRQRLEHERLAKLEEERLERESQAKQKELRRASKEEELRIARNEYGVVYANYQRQLTANIGSGSQYDTSRYKNMPWYPEHCRLWHIQSQAQSKVYNLERELESLKD